MKDDILYLIHISECLSRIEQYTREGRESFLSDTKTQDAVLRNLQTLSESTQRLSVALKTEHSEINWRGIAGFRNILVHNYLGVKLDRVWGIVEHDVPELKRNIEALLAHLQPNQGTMEQKGPL